MDQLSPEDRAALLAAGASPAALNRFDNALADLHLPQRPSPERLEADSRMAQAIYRTGAALCATWPAKPARDKLQERAAGIVKAALRKTRNAFALCYAALIYERITGGRSRFIRAEELLDGVADLCPGLCPSRAELADESRLPLADKEGVEIAQADFLSHLLANRHTGDHLIHAMLRPLPQSLESLARFRRDGLLDLGTVQLERRGSLGCVSFNNLAYLNAEDDTTLIPLECAVDLVLLDPEIRTGLLRGNRVEHPKYRGRRIFSAGLNLSRLYQGKIPFLFYLTRDLGVVNKLYRGLTGDCFDPDGPEETLEKPWMAVVEGFAIGGGCQLLLVLDYVIAEQGAYCNLPARKEGIIPGAAPLRLGRFTGLRQAQAGILFAKPFPVDSPEGRCLVSEILPGGQIDGAIERLAADIAASGLVSAGANRKAIRVGQEPRELFRQYMALYCREQADCHFSPELIDNLERHWVSRPRPGDRDRS